MTRDELINEIVDKELVPNFAARIEQQIEDGTTTEKGYRDTVIDLPPWNVPISKVRIWDTSKGDSMSRKRYTAEQIIGHLRQAEIRTSEGKTIAEAVRELGISEQTYYRWRKQYAANQVNQLFRIWVAVFLDVLDKILRAPFVNHRGVR